MSIIIVGVGSAEFDGKRLVRCDAFNNLQLKHLFEISCFCSLTEMVELDGDEVRISSRGRFAERDIVQVGCSAILIFLFYYSLFFMSTKIRVLISKI